MPYSSASHPTPPGPAGRTWLFAGVFALLLLAAWAAGPAHAQDATIQQTVPPGRIYLPLLQTGIAPTAHGCLPVSANVYDPVPILGQPRPALPAPIDDPDLNLTVRSWSPTLGVTGLITLGGETDVDPPQLAHLFRPPRLATFSALYQMHDWNWNGICAQSAEEPGCRGLPLVNPEVTLVELATTPEEPLYLPGRRADILNGTYQALVLYAEETRLTVGYTRDDSPAHGYVIHLENLCVDANLLALYQQLHQAGRSRLPGLRLDVPLGVSRAETVLLAIRDSGSFMDPRSRKDWWHGY